MKRKTRKLVNNLGAVIAFIVSLGIGGLFISGGFSGVFLLKLLPLLVHQIAGWIIVGGTILSAVANFLK